MFANYIASKMTGSIVPVVVPPKDQDTAFIAPVVIRLGRQPFTVTPLGSVRPGEVTAGLAGSLGPQPEPVVVRQLRHKVILLLRVDGDQVRLEQHRRGDYDVQLRPSGSDIQLLPSPNFSSQENICNICLQSLPSPAPDNLKNRLSDNIVLRLGSDQIIPWVTSSASLEELQQRDPVLKAKGWD